jgi:hypothetical protein
MGRGWRRLTCPAVLGAMIAVVLTGSAGRAHAGGGSGLDVPFDGWTAATWRDSTPDERRGYLLGLTEGLRLATALDRAQVDRSTVVDCAQGLRAEHLPAWSRTTWTTPRSWSTSPRRPSRSGTRFWRYAATTPRGVAATAASGCSSISDIRSPSAVLISPAPRAKPRAARTSWSRRQGVISSRCPRPVTGQPSRPGPEGTDECPPCSTSRPAR